VCLLVLAWAAHPRYQLVVAANRDEYHERPAAPLAKWPEPPGILAGRDLRAAGTWLGLDPARRFGVVTNFRELQSPRPAAPSRGGLIPRYLSGSHGARQFFAQLEPAASEYSGFNLLLTDAASLWYGSNRAAAFARELPPGVYGLSNELLDTPWPKLTRVRARFEARLESSRIEAEDLLPLLADHARSPADELPNTGLPHELERALSAPFIVTETYGTRCSTALTLDEHGRCRFIERSFDPSGRPIGDARFDFETHGAMR